MSCCAMIDKKPVIGISADIKTVDGEMSFVMDTVYADAVAGYGGLPLFIPSLAGAEGTLLDIVGAVDGLLVPGGRDMDPAFYNEQPRPGLRLMDAGRTKAELCIMDEALKLHKPVLGICNGMQLINVFFGGTLYQDIPSQLPDALDHEGGAVHAVEVCRGTLLYTVLDTEEFSLKSHHHQSVKDVGKGLRVAALAPDGVTEAIEGDEGFETFVLGVQWHPERDDNELSKRLFEAFIYECAGGLGSSTRYGMK